MLNSIINKLNTSTRIKIIIIISLILILSHSLFLTLAITVLAAIIFILYNINVKYYIITIKGIIIWLLLIYVTYIIIFGNTIRGLVFIFKMLLIILLVCNFILTITFNKVHSGFDKCIPKINFSRISTSKLAYKAAIFILYLQYLIESKVIILKNQRMKQKRRISVKYFLLPSLILSTNDIQNLENLLLANHYVLKKEKLNALSLGFELVFLLLLIVVIIKEVIL